MRDTRTKKAERIWVIADADFKKSMRDMHHWGFVDMIGKHNAETRIALIEKRWRKKYGHN